MPAKRLYLQCVNGHYRYRRRWPAHVRRVAGGEFFIRHLGTSSLECESACNFDPVRG